MSASTIMRNICRQYPIYTCCLKSPCSYSGSSSRKGIPDFYKSIIDYHCSSSMDPQPDNACNQFSSKKWDTTPPSFSCKIWDLGLQYLGSRITIVGISYDLGSRKIRDTNLTSFYRKIWDLGVPNLGGLRTKDLA